MMFSAQKLANALNNLKWKRRSESSLTTGLLNNDVHYHEIELSDYLRAPSPGSESPSGLLNGDSLNVDPIDDLDLFVERLYGYYCQKGLWCIIIKWIVEFLTLAFTICFSGFFLLFVDWNGLRNAKCGMDAVESGIKPCDLSKEALHKHPFTPFTLHKAVIVGYLGIFSGYTIFTFLRFFAQLKYTLKIRQFYNNSLHLTDNEIQTMPWALVLEKVVQSQNSQQWCLVKDLSAHDIVMRLMRKENYLIGMLNKGVLSFPIPQWVPGAGPVVKFGSSGAQYRLMLTKTLYVIVSFISVLMFDRKFCIRSGFVSDPKALKKLIVVIGLVMLLLSPCLVVFMLVYLFLRHAEQFYNHPSTASSRRWSNLSKWIFREFNEVDHLFQHRMNSSLEPASEYLKQFPSPILSIIAKFISFVSGGFAAILIIIAFLEESLLEGHIFGRNLFWYAAVFGTITAISRAAVTDELLVLDPRGAMSMVIQHTHYMPKRWRGKENTDVVRMEFETLFQYTGMMLLEEMASIFLTPFLLIFVAPKRVDDILQFISDFTVDIEGVGNVCSFSAFDFQKHGNNNYGSPCNLPRFKRSSQGKMEKSFLSFQNNYPSWEPNAQGKQFLSTIETFREQKMQRQVTTGPAHSPSRIQQWTLNPRQHGDRNNFFVREKPRIIGDPSGSMWPTDSEDKNYPYILDWYYTSGPHHATNNSINAPPENIDIPKESPRLWVPPSDSRQNNENWSHLSEDRSRSQEASTSVPLYHASVLEHYDSGNVVGNTSTSRWYDRAREGAGPQGSFINPPNFNQNNDNYHDNLSEGSMDEQEQYLGSLRSNHSRLRRFVNPPNFNQNNDNYHDNLSERSMDEHEQYLGMSRSNHSCRQRSSISPPNFNQNDDYHDNLLERSMDEQEQYLELLRSNHSRRLSLTTYMDDLDVGGEVDLPFGDIYSKDTG
ncbi:hypothetical protein LguiA_020494 [Lonicera macranthoides]